MAPLNTLASETWISASILVLILELFTNAALKLASGIVTFWVYATPIKAMLAIAVNSKFSIFMKLFLEVRAS
jgi:membrane protein implicated in regulation of membrane protease activity